MFTGIIAERGRVSRLEKKGGISHLNIRSETIAQSSAIGDSIAINGVCLTITRIEDDIMQFDVSVETLNSTNIGGLKNGNTVNLEAALRPSDRMGGHFVTGHIDGTGIIRSKEKAGEAVRIEIEAPEVVMQYTVRKGSIAVDGISLTVVDLYKNSFTVVIIPHTDLVTTISEKGVQDTVNLETDIIGKYVARFLSKTELDDKDQVFMKKLQESGWEV